MASDNVYLYSGTNDHVVNSAAMHKLQTYYEHYVTNGNITTEYTVDSAHGMPTLDYGNPCSLQGEPYIQKCEYDGAGHILQTLYGTLNPRGPPRTATSSPLIRRPLAALMPSLARLVTCMCPRPAAMLLLAASTLSSTAAGSRLSASMRTTSSTPATMSGLSPTTSSFCTLSARPPSSLATPTPASTGGATPTSSTPPRMAPR